jgi:hypothetical protein
MVQHWDFSVECIKPAHMCFTLFFAILQFMIVVLFMQYLPGAKDVYQQIGYAFWDLSFIDHSDNYQECNCARGSDIYSVCGAFLMGNISLCEEKQFESEVLSGRWLWEGSRYRDFYIFNVTNPTAAASGEEVIVQELNPIPFVDHRKSNAVDRSSLDEKGILSFGTDASWSIDPSRGVASTAAGDVVVVPHYVFATLLQNGVGGIERSTAMQEYPTYYPLLTTVRVSSYMVPETTSDYLTRTYSDQAVLLINREVESLLSSYFSSEKLGLQGLSFVHSIWSSEDGHCGYDADCIDRPKTQTRISFHQSATCLEKPFCNPRTLKHQAQGLEFGVSSLRWMPGASYNGIKYVVPGEDNVWDYTAFNKIGTKWPAVNEAFFILYDIVLGEATQFVGLPVLRWSFGSYHQDRENCENQGGGVSDSPGIDCSSPEGMPNVGPAFDEVLPGPLHLSFGDVVAGGAWQKIRVLNCVGSPLGCQSRNADFEMLSHEILGRRIGYRNSYSLSVRLQQSMLFSNAAVLTPLFWCKEFFYIGQKKSSAHLDL